MGNKPKIIRDKLRDKIFNDIWKFFETGEEKKIEKKKYIERIVKNRIIKDIRTLLEQEKQEYYYEPKRVSNFGNNN